ncbi:MAG TPA: ThiF family adenylyltransferase [Galbitalea sp.]|jgi:adenylyltransferase/sulfurtransferase|nr:ThiF family adenylyltransferase [Galbitalea sp.]
MSLPPLVEPGPPLSPDAALRGARNIALPAMGEVGQRRLRAARVLVIGAGGLGSPVLQFLAGAGVGVIGIVDFDVVDATNLQRQVIHRTADVGELKTVSAARAIRDLDPTIETIQFPVELTAENALELIGGFDLVADGSDNFATRYLASDAAAMLHTPYVWGSVLRMDGQVTVFWEGAPDGRSLDYRDLHPIPPAPDDVLSCSVGGVLGSVCGMIGSAMATEIIKLITGVGEPLLGRVQNLDALSGTWRTFELRRAPDREPVAALADYLAFCGVPEVPAELEIDHIDPARELIDVREPYERFGDRLAGDRSIPLGLLLNDPTLAGPGPVLLYCATGIRSARAAAVLRDVGIDALSLRGGIEGLRAVA